VVAVDGWPAIGAHDQDRQAAPLTGRPRMPLPAGVIGDLEVPGADCHGVPGTADEVMGASPHGRRRMT
jgi:hypothetical protein